MCISLMLQPKAKDSFNSQWTSMVERKEKQYTTIEKKEASKANGKDVKDSRGLWRNNRYTVIDTIAYWKPIKILHLPLVYII